MDPRLLEALQVDHDVLSSSAAFFETYALLCEEELSDTPAAAELDWEHPPTEPPEEQEFLRLATTTAPGDETIWRLIGEAACARQEAARLRLLTDLQAGRNQLGAASNGYLALGLPYGYLLRSLARGPSDPSWILEGPARWLAELQSRESRSAELRPPLLEEALATPAQQAYLLLVTASHPRAVQQNQGLLADVADAPQSRGAAPVGPQSVPLSTYWRIGQLLTAVHRGDEAAQEELIAETADLARRQGRSLEQAQFNRYEWQLLTAPVDIVDLDLAAIVMAASTAIQALDLRPLTLADFNAVPEPGLVSIAVGLDLSLDPPNHQ